jgi:hypothetical protein
MRELPANCPIGVTSGRAHSRDQFVYDRKSVKADVISLRRLALPLMLPVLSKWQLDSYSPEHLT